METVSLLKKTRDTPTAHQYPVTLKHCFFVCTHFTAQDLENETRPPRIAKYPVTVLRCGRNLQEEMDVQQSTQIAVFLCAHIARYSCLVFASLPYDTWYT